MSGYQLDDAFHVRLLTVSGTDLEQSQTVMREMTEAMFNAAHAVAETYRQRPEVRSVTVV